MAGYHWMTIIPAMNKAASPLKIEICHSFQNILDNGNQWDKLLDKSSSNTIFLTAGWLHSWQLTHGKDSRLIIVQAFRFDQLVAAAAFENTAGVLIFAGKGPSDYSDLILSNDLNSSDEIEVVDALLDGAAKVADNFRYFKLGRVQEGSRPFQHLSSEHGKYRATVTNRTAAPRMDMRVVEEKLKKKSLVRHERKLGKIGELVYIHSKDSKEIYDLLEQLFDQHIARWNNTPYPSQFVGEISKEFFRQVVLNLGGSGCLRFSALRLDGKLVAAHFGFVHAGRYTWYKPSYDVSISKLSPGEVLLKRMLEAARCEEIGVFDFTIGNEAFKLRFATEVPMVEYFYVTSSMVRHYAVRFREGVKALLLSIRGN